MQSKVKGKKVHPIQPLQNPINLENVKTINLADFQPIKSTGSQESHKSQQQYPQGRRKQSLWIYISILLVTISMSADNFPFFVYPKEKMLILAIQLSLLIPKLIFLTASVCEMCTCRQFFQYAAMVDNIMLTGASSLVAVIMIVIFLAESALDYAIIPGYFVLHILYGTNFRIMIVYCKWNRCQVVLYKCALLFSCLFYMFIGCFVLLMNLKFTDGQNPEKDDSFFNFVVVYLAAAFSFYFEMFSKVTDFDGTNELRNRYTLMDLSQEEAQTRNQKTRFRKQSMATFNQPQSRIQKARPRKQSMPSLNDSSHQFGNRLTLKREQKSEPQSTVDK